MRTASGAVGIRPGRGLGVRPKRAALGVRPGRPATIRASRRQVASRRRLALVFGVFLVAVFVGMAQVWVRLRIVRLGYALSAEANRTARLERLVRKLSVERALLRNPERIRKIAVEQLGLRPPRPDEIVEIHPLGVFGGGLWVSDEARRRARGDGSILRESHGTGQQLNEKAKEVHR